MRKLSALALAFTLASAVAAGQEHSAKPNPAAAMKPMHTIMNSADITWGDQPPGLPPGAKMALLAGDPSKPGLFIVRMKAPDGYTIPAHWHPTAESLTVISGTFNLQTGDGANLGPATALKAGGFASMPPNMRHKAVCQGDTEVQITAMGPFQITYVNPADDPRKPLGK
ncbi:MAG: cupin domain-containing protein [Acidobacteriota bacterium]